MSMPSGQMNLEIKEGDLTSGVGVSNGAPRVNPWYLQFTPCGRHPDTGMNFGIHPRLKTWYSSCRDKIPEFDAPYSISAYQKRLEGTRQLVLTAFGKDGAIGFKIGYDRFADGSFYSWMGGVLPEYRRQRVAERLADYQEKWAKKVGYKSIRLITRKKHQHMITFSEQREFVVRKVVPKIPAQETRIWMEKTL